MDTASIFLEARQKKLLEAYARLETFLEIKYSPLRPVANFARLQATEVSRLWKKFSGQIPKKPTDVLFLHTYREEPARLSATVSALNKLGLSVSHDYLDQRPLIYRNVFAPLPGRIHSSLKRFAYEAQFLVYRYSPKVIVTLENSLLLSPFLRYFSRESGGCTINLSHGVTANHPGHFMNDFDFYFLFGESSKKNLIDNSGRFGTSRAILVGSPFIPSAEFIHDKFKDESLSFVDPTILYFSSWIPDSEEGKLARANAQLFFDWARSMPPSWKLKVKLHPLEDPSFVEGQLKDVAGVKILPKSVSMWEALQNVNFCVTQWSNAAIEAALAGKPCIVLNTDKKEDAYLSMDRFYPRARTKEDLDLHSAYLLKMGGSSKNLADAFADYHLATRRSVDLIAHSIKEVFDKGVGAFPDAPLIPEPHYF